MNTNPSPLKRLWDWLGEVEIPIGEPWFGFRTILLRPMALWPIAWQGWAVLVVALLWLASFAVLLVWSGTQPSDWWTYGWLLPTTIVFCVVVGIKTDYRWPNGE